MNGLLYFIVLFFAAAVAVFIGTLVGGIVWHAKGRAKKAFIARIKKQFLREHPELNPEEFKLRISRIFQKSGCCHTILWEEVDAKSGKPLRHFCDNCGKENIKTIRGYVVKEGQ